MKKILHFPLLVGAILLGNCTCSKTTPDPEPPPPPQNFPVKIWVTSADGANLLYQKSLDFKTAKDERFPVVEVDTTQVFQTIDGFGYTLTGGSAMLLHQLAPAARTAILKELFGTETNSIGVSYLRISLGASDLDAEVFSYDDLPAGQTDPDLQFFSLSKDTQHLIPVLKEILAIRPDLKIMASPWSPPVWMKTNGNSVGGGLKPQFYASYAKYFVKYIEHMAARAIPIHAVTPQNEPQHGGNNPSMVMSSTEQADFVKNHLGPAFAAAGISTKIIVWDHNCDNPQYPIAILDDPAARGFVDGSAFHLYAGDVSALSLVHDKHPDKNLYFTEQWTSSTGDFGGDLMWHLRNVVIGTMRNHARVALEWNLANDPNFGPHTPGGCTQCRGALTVNGQIIIHNVSFYIIAQVARFVPPGSVRIGSNLIGQTQNVAFQRPDGKKVLLFLNEGNAAETFNIHCGERWMVATVNPRSAATFVW